MTGIASPISSESNESLVHKLCSLYVCILAGNNLFALDCVGMTSDVIRTFDTITDLHEVLTEIRGEPAVNRTTTCKQRFGFWF